MLSSSKPTLRWNCNQTLGLSVISHLGVITNLTERSWLSSYISPADIFHYQVEVTYIQMSLWSINFYDRTISHEAIDHQCVYGVVCRFKNWFIQLGCSSDSASNWLYRACFLPIHYIFVKNTDFLLSEVACLQLGYRARQTQWFNPRRKITASKHQSKRSNIGAIRTMSYLILFIPYLVCVII